MSPKILFFHATFLTLLSVLFLIFLFTFFCFDPIPPCPPPPQVPKHMILFSHIGPYNCDSDISVLTWSASLWYPNQTYNIIDNCSVMSEPGLRFINGLWAHNPNLVKLHVAFTWKRLTRSCRNFAHVTTAELSWHVQILAWSDHKNDHWNKDIFYKISIVSSYILCEMISSNTGWGKIVEINGCLSLSTILNRAIAQSSFLPSLTREQVSGCVVKWRSYDVEHKQWLGLGSAMQHTHIKWNEAMAHWSVTDFSLHKETRPSITKKVTFLWIFLLSQFCGRGILLTAVK